MSPDTQRRQKRVFGPLELELKAVVNHAMWVLKSEDGPFARTVNACNHQAIIPDAIILPFNAHIKISFNCFLHD